MPEGVAITERELALHFRDQLREARYKALKDAEAFDEIIFAVEQLGRHLKREGIGLGQYAGKICEQARHSPLAERIPSTRRDLHTPFPKLFDMVREGRNQAMHEGVFARHLTEHAVELCIVLEHSLMPPEKYDRVSDYMVRGPECAALWHPLSFIRQTLLKTSFSYLPVLVQENDKSIWKLVSDCALARYFRTTTNKNDLTTRLGQTLADAISTGLALDTPHVCRPEANVKEALDKCCGKPILVQAVNSNDLLGILTPFDLL